MPLRRESDRLNLVLAAFGAALAAAGIAMSFAQPLRVPPWLIAVFIALGAGMINPKFVTDIFKIWRGGSTGHPNEKDDSPS